MTGFVVTMALYVIVIILSQVCTLAEGSFSWLRPFFHDDPLGQVLKNFIRIVVLGTLFGMFIDVLYYQDARHGRWAGNMRMMFASLQGHGEISRASAWLNITGTVICPAVLLVFDLVMIIMTIVNASKRRKIAEQGRQAMEVDPVGTTIARAKIAVKDARSSGQYQLGDLLALDEYVRRLDGPKDDAYDAAKTILRYLPDGR